MNHPGRDPKKLRLRRCLGLTASAAAVAAALLLTGVTFAPAPAPAAAPANAGDPLAAFAPHFPPASIAIPYNPESATPLGTPAPLKTASTAYTIPWTNKDGRPVTWDPCRPIHYVTREANAPAEGPQLIQDAIAAASRATGLVFINDGATTEAPSPKHQSYQYERYGNRPAPVLIAWETPDENPEFVDHGKGVVMGHGGSVGFQSPDGRYTYTSGQITLNAPGFKMIMGREGIGTARGVIEHELGHVLGLDHISDPTQLMNSTMTPGITEYQAGDLAGLAIVGQGKCEPDL